MARVNVLDRITYGRVAYLCNLQASDAHILGSTLWASTPSIMIIAGILVGATRYNCAEAPCIVDDTGRENKIWYGGINNDLGVPVMWLVEHACRIQRQGKHVEYFSWPVTPHVMLLADGPAVKRHLLHWTPNSMAAACMRKKALDWLVDQLGVSDSVDGWTATIDLRKDSLLKPSDTQK